MAGRVCGGCAARRAALKAAREAGEAPQFLWTPPSGSTLPPTQYDSEMAAKAKVMRKGGTYRPLSPEA